MRRAIGVSTHVIDPKNVRGALHSIRSLKLPAFEVSSLRILEPRDVLALLDEPGLEDFSRVSFHLPGSFERYSAQDAADLVAALRARGWPVVAHPDSLEFADAWSSLGEQLCIENMDKRKATGRTAAELADVFMRFPEASLCFDLGHAKQIDPTMTEAALILRRFGDRLKQVHLSEVNTRSEHEGITYTAFNSFRKVAHLIPLDTPIILETPVALDQIETQSRLAEQALTPPDSRFSSGDPVAGAALAGRIDPKLSPVKP